jgi:adenylate cyclase
MITKSNLKQILIISLIWVVAGLFTALYEFFFLANYPGVLETDAMLEFELKKNIIAAMGGLFVGSILFSAMELFYFQRKVKREKFWIAVIKKMGLYTILLIGLLFGISLIYNSILSTRSISDPVAWNLTKDFILSKAFWHPVIPILLLASLSSIMIQFSERFGTNEMWKMLSGKYFNPKEERRIFMFLDLNSSTTIAEKLGNEKFYQYLNDFYHDIAPIITLFKGEVVEYVGDEVIITWTFPEGIVDTKCLACFMGFQQVIESKRATYLERYNEVPDFKAAVHCGSVMIGEMGKIKKTIKFSGDVLNTTARVEKICGNIGAKMVITDHLMSALTKPGYPMEKISNINLKGKEKPMDVYRVLVKEIADETE